MDDQNVVEQTIKVVKGGGIIIYPTDTAFGIGCRIDNQAAVDRLFKLRRRPVTQATPVLVASPEMAIPYFDHPPEIVRRLMKDYWPGALTIIYHCQKDLLYSPIRGGGDTVGLRMPNHETAFEIIKGVGVPILGPSANFHGEPTPFYLTDLNPEFIKLVDLVVPGECQLKQPSTVVDCTISPYRILRQGAVVLP